MGMQQPIASKTGHRLTRAFYLSLYRSSGISLFWCQVEGDHTYDCPRYVTNSATTYPWTKHHEGNLRASWIFPHQNDLPKPTAFYVTKMPAPAHMATHAGLSTSAPIVSTHTMSPAALAMKVARHV